MDDPTQNTPFITRKMLAFEGAATFSLVLNVFGISGNPVTVTGGTKDGIFTFTYITLIDYTAESATFGLNDIPIWISVNDTNGAFKYGDMHIVLGLQINQNLMQTLMAGYVSIDRNLTWPIAISEPQLPLEYYEGNSATSDPAAGAEMSYVISTDIVRRLKALRITLVTDNTATTRQVHLQLLSGANVKWDIPAAGSQAASLTRQYTFLPGVTAVGTAVDGEIVTQIPKDLLLLNGDTLRTVTTNLAAGDNYGAGQLRLVTSVKQPTN